MLEACWLTSISVVPFVILPIQFVLSHYFCKGQSEAVAQRCSVKNMFLKISQNSQENNCARVSFLITMQACNLLKKEALAQVFSCEFCEIFKHNFIYIKPLVTPSGQLTVEFSHPIRVISTS